IAALVISGAVLNCGPFVRFSPLLMGPHPSCEAWSHCGQPGQAGDHPRRVMCPLGLRCHGGWDFDLEEEAVARYPNIADHGLIGDLQTAALVTTDGVLDWFCCPRFDSPSVFASLLDADHGGFYRTATTTWPGSCTCPTQRS